MFIGLSIKIRRSEPVLSDLSFEFASIKITSIDKRLMINLKLKSLANESVRVDHGREKRIISNQLTMRQVSLH